MSCPAARAAGRQLERPPEMQRCSARRSTGPPALALIDRTTSFGTRPAPWPASPGEGRPSIEQPSWSFAWSPVSGSDAHGVSKTRGRRCGWPVPEASRLGHGRLRELVGVTGVRRDITSLAVSACRPEELALVRQCLRQRQARTRVVRRRVLGEHLLGQPRPVQVTMPGYCSAVTGRPLRRWRADERTHLVLRPPLDDRHVGDQPERSRSSAGRHDRRPGHR